MTHLMVMMSTLLVVFLVISTSANQRYGPPRASENVRDDIIFDREDYDDYGLLIDQGMVEEQYEITTKSRPIPELFNSPSIQTRWRTTTTKLPRKPITTTRKTKTTHRKFTTRKPKTTTRNPKTTTRKFTTKKPKVVSTTKKPQYTGCGTNIYKSKIVGGQQVDAKGKFPWMVALLDKDKMEQWVFGCGGVIFSSRHILTASHCFSDDKPSPLDVMVRLGESNMDSLQASPSRRDVAVSAIFMHEGFNRSTMINDIAILQLKDRIDWTDMIRPICLPTATALNLEGRMATVTGWGNLFHGGTSSQFLMEVDLPIIGVSQCNKSYDAIYDIWDQTPDEPFSRWPVVKENICTGYPKGEKDPCRGDSGGPLIFQADHTKPWTVIGVVSWGTCAGGQGLPSVYARVESHIDWIKSKMTIK